MRGSLILAAASSLFSAQQASAQTVGGNVQALHSTTDKSSIAVEYYWKKGDCGGFGFLDTLPNSGAVDFLTNNVVDCNVAGPTFASAEAAATNLGKTLRLGGGINIPAPGMKSLRATVYPIVRGGEDKPQVKVTWLSEDFELSESTSVYTSGFVRVRKGAPDVAQPQVWVKNKDLPFEFGAEVAYFGGKADLYLGVKFNF